MPSISMELKGADRLLRMAKAAADRGMLTQLAQSVTDVANQVAAESLSMVPVDTGALKGSIMVSPPSVSPDEVDVTISYGGAAAPYAEYVHENLAANHPNGGQAKFLEIPVRRWEPMFVKKVQAMFIARLEAQR